VKLIIGPTEVLSKRSLSVIKHILALKIRQEVPKLSLSALQAGAYLGLGSCVGR